MIRDALREWEMAQARREQELLSLRKDIAEGLADIEAGRVGTFDPKEIIRRREKLLAAQNSRSRKRNGPPSFFVAQSDDRMPPQTERLWQRQSPQPTLSS